MAGAIPAGKLLICGSGEHLSTGGYRYQHISGYCKSYELAVTCCSATPQATSPLISAAKTQPEAGSALPSEDLEARPRNSREGM